MLRGLALGSNWLTHAGSFPLGCRARPTCPAMRSSCRLLTPPDLRSWSILRLILSIFAEFTISYAISRKFAQEKRAGLRGRWHFVEGPHQVGAHCCEKATRVRIPPTEAAANSIRPAEACPRPGRGLRPPRSRPRGTPRLSRWGLLPNRCRCSLLHRKCSREMGMRSDGPGPSRIGSGNGRETHQPWNRCCATPPASAWCGRRPPCGSPRSP